MQVEYRVRPVTRYVVTRWQQGASYGDSQCAGSVEPRGEFDNEQTAYAVAYALCGEEHRQSGEPEGSMNFIYPKPVQEPAPVEPVVPGGA